MSNIFLIIVAITVVSFIAARLKSLGIANRLGGRKNLDSLPRFYGYHAAIWAGVPALLFLLIFIGSEEKIINGLVIKQAPSELQAQNTSLVLNDIKLVAASGQTDAPQVTRQLAQKYTELKDKANVLKYALCIGLACLGAFIGFSRVKAGFKARNGVETFIRYVLAFCSVIAIATTVGIVLSVAFESVRFFSDVPFYKFLFGTHWSPKRGGS